MNRFHGIVGYVEEREYPAGAWQPIKTERTYSGEVIQMARSWTKGESTNDNLTITNQIRILADDYAMDHLSEIKYVRWRNSDWKVTRIELEHPRISLTLGGVYNGNKIRAAR